MMEQKKNKSFLINDKEARVWNIYSKSGHFNFKVVLSTWYERYKVVWYNQGTI